MMPGTSNNELQPASGESCPVRAELNRGGVTWRPSKITACSGTRIRLSNEKKDPKQ